jgi:hypothetical protein
MTGRIVRLIANDRLAYMIQPLLTTSASKSDCAMRKMKIECPFL